MVSRANFIRGKFSSDKASIRPPWSMAEEQFVEKCTRCDACIKVCPTKIIERDDAGFPKINFHRGECEFCGDCVQSCETGALDKDALALSEENSPPWNLSISLAEHCLVNKKVVCRSCGEVCDERAIKFKPAIGGVFIPKIDLSQCSGCGACVSVCPVDAVIITA